MTGDPLTIVPVILAGGMGTRLWPLSRASHPKQFIEMGLDGSPWTLFQQAALRIGHIAGQGIDVRASIVVANEEHRFTVTDQLRAVALDNARVLLEPAARNTAPALALAAIEALACGDGSDPILVVTPADHAIVDSVACTAALRNAVAAAAKGSILMLGIRPDRPESGYGYIRTLAAERDGATPSAAVDGFVEKPDRATAERYLAEGNYFWNSGMFVLRASTWLAALARFRPDISTAAESAARTSSVDGPFLRYDIQAFSAIPAQSIDFAVMEPASSSGSPFDLQMVPLDAGWSDLGAWDAVWEASEHDAQGNAQHGDVIVQDSRNTLVHATSRLVGVIGLDDITVVETADAVLVAHRSTSPVVKDFVSALALSGRSEAGSHHRSHRPWGWYESIDRGPRFQVKRIMVKPGARLSLQMHHHRAEHWVVVTGTAEVTNGSDVMRLSENQSTYIPPGQTHRLANPGDVPLEIIEVQSGSYLGEDDIVRFEDSYGRN